MKAHQLRFDNLIDINHRSGIITFNQERMTLVSVKALGILRQDLVNTLGMERAKGFLMRYGWTWGKKDGESIASKYSWSNKKELILAGPSLHTLEGVVTANPEVLEISHDSLYFRGHWYNSYEAEEHVKHYGYSDETVCWTLVGYASGYLTSTFGRDVVVYEDTCVGKGDSHCTYVANTVDKNKEKHKKYMRYYKAESLITELDRAYHELRQVNQNITETDKVQDELINLFLEDKELSDTIAYVANIINKSIVIDYYNKMIESYFIHKKDELVYHQWAEKSLYSAEQQNDISTFPIRAHNLNLGRMVVIGHEKMTQKDQLTIKRALGILTIQMFHQWKITRSLWKKKEEFFEEMLLNPNNEQFEKRSHLFNFHPSAFNRILSIKIVPSEKCQPILQLLNTTYPDIDIFSKKNYIILILSKSSAKHMDRITEDILELLQEKFPRVRAYLGAGREATNLPSLAKSYQDACKISDFLHITEPTVSRIAFFEDLEPIMMFLKGTDPEELIEFYQKTIGVLVKYDRENNSNFLMTLKSYLDHNGNLQQTANHLHLSIAGLRYRIDRIETLCQTDLKSGAERFKFQLAIQIYFAIRLTDHSSQQIM
ncbi:XylR N-terminal domain-containing protein [Aliibacillus thermotolerans]|uniref:XylR N-terminal domain-containing protein n=1 Tax=Aliibacillus thermotolerans TaxID=1834418 RepID=A0ABW0U5T9_9BACI|nr:XylR N-terminal domain-containing protein [Aliibacillus thermotolerans]MDA3130302.1 hypothetical protein [Aliibacillus thermotolerans]